VNKFKSCERKERREASGSFKPSVADTQCKKCKYAHARALEKSVELSENKSESK
jgi:hypothetical protein